MPPRHPHPTGQTARPRRRRRGNLPAIEACARQVFDRLVAVAGLGLLATLASTRIAIRNEAAEPNNDGLVAGYHHLVPLIRHARYDAVRVGDVGTGVAMIMAELVGTVALIALLVGWVERRKARSRSSSSTPSAAHRGGGR
jgi:hypothetical protein